MSKVNDGVRAAGHASLKAAHDELNLTGGDSWSKFYGDMVPDAPSLGDAMAEYWGGATGGIYRRAVFALDARKTPGRLSTNVIQDLSPNALSTASGSAGSAAIVQDGQGGKALRTHRSLTGFASTPDAAVLDVTGDLDIRVRATTQWATSEAAAIGLLGKDDGATNRSFSFGVNPSSSNGLVFAWSTLGTAASRTLVASPVPTGLANGETKWARVTLDVDDGAGNRVITFYLSDDGTNWTMLGSPVVQSGVTSVFSGNAPLDVGRYAGLSGFSGVGLIHRAQVFDGIDGTLVADFDPSRDASFSSLSWTSATTGETWTVTPGGSDTNDPLWLPYSDERYVHTPITVGGNGLTADAAVSVPATDNHSFVCRMRAPWVSGVSGSTMFRTPLGLGAATSTSAQAPHWRWAESSRQWQMVMSEVGAFRTIASVTNTAAISGIADDMWVWFRFRFIYDDGGSWRGRWDYSLQQTSDESEVVWTEWATNTATQYSVTASTDNAVVGNLRGLNANYNAGDLQVVSLYDNAGATLLKFHANTDIVDANHTTFTSSTHTFTVNRAASGRKTCVVEASKWALGTDDYIEVADNALLDFEASDLFTVMWVGRQFDTSQAIYVAKRDQVGNTPGADIGWVLYNASGTTVPLYRGDNGTTIEQDSSASRTDGALASVAITRTSNTANTTLNGVGTAAAITAGNLSNSTALRIGRAGASYGDFELYAVYIWREALSADELAAIAADWGIS